MDQSSVFALVFLVLDDTFMQVYAQKQPLKPQVHVEQTQHIPIS